MAEAKRSAGALASARNSTWSCATVSVGRSAAGGAGISASCWVDEVGAEERRASGERVEERRAERVQIGGGPDRRAADLLGGHVRDGAEEAPGLGLAEVGQVGAAEVAQLGVAGGVVEDVGRLHVAVDDAALVRGAEGGEQIERQPPARRRRQRPRRRDLLGERPAGHQLEHEQPRRRLRVVQGDDVGVAEAPGCLGLAREAQIGLARRIGVTAAAAGEQLERHGRPEQGVDRLVDARVGAPAEHPFDLEAPGRLRPRARVESDVAGGRGLGVLQRGHLLGAAREGLVVPP